MSPEPTLLAYHEARSRIRDLDVIAFRGNGIVSRAIRRVTGGTVTHVGIAVWWGDALMILESREMRGHRTVWLSREIKKAGSVLWYRSRDLDKSVDSYNGSYNNAVHNALSWAQRASGAPYSYRGCLRFLRRVMPTLFAFLPNPDRDSLGYGPRFCSAFVSAVLRMAAADPRTELDDAATSPADLVASPRLELLGRLEVVPR